MVNRRKFILATGQGVGFGLISPALFTLSDDKAKKKKNDKPISFLKEKIIGAIYGIAIGDGMGAPVEGNTAKYIKELLGNRDKLDNFLPSHHPNEPNTGKGNGRITDDTLMTEALIRAYIKGLRHFDAYDYVTYFIPEVFETVVWVPEYQKDMKIYDRIWWPEKYPYQKLVVNNSDPRIAGMGNNVNCGLAMFLMPIGAINAGDPSGAYMEATAFGLAHNESYAVEAGGAIAAAYAEAFKFSSTIDSIIAAAIDLSKDGTKDAIESVTRAVNISDPLDDFIVKVRKAFLPFSGLRPDSIEEYLDKTYLNLNIRGMNTPSRNNSIEELPVALAVLKYGNNDFNKTLKAGCFYGNDTDSICEMACGLFGALKGVTSLPEKLVADSNAANRRDFSFLGEQLYDAVVKITKSDITRIDEKQKAIGL
jgi:ADP-ribosylglycohydrolase